MDNNFNNEEQQPINRAVEGRIIQVLPLQSGVSKAGNNWKKQEYVLETHDQYPRKVKFDFFGERADQYVLAVGDDVTVWFDIESREYNGRWYTDIRAWKALKKQGASSESYPTAPQGGFTSAPAPEAFGPSGMDMPSQSPFPQGNPAADDLPF